jgi:hypothetical protein
MEFLAAKAEASIANIHPVRVPPGSADVIISEILLRPGIWVEDKSIVLNYKDEVCSKVIVELFDHKLGVSSS